MEVTRWRRILIIGTAALAVACARQQGADNEAGGTTAGVNDARPADSPSVADRSSAQPDRDAPDRAAPPDADSLLPHLPGYTTDDDAEPGEVEASLDHGSIPYEQVRRRIVLDEQGFTSGVVTVVTFRPESGAAGQILDHTYGDAPRSSIRMAGVEMTRIETEHFAVIAWVGPGFVVTFQRGQERSDEWLEDLIGSTVRAVADSG
jgi:hypothetical protein